ncbi:MAG: hypothetical protein K8R40_05900 [Anaerolineaceae bacterium]|nr:hypothetical protein [Anaerolineaceae bacterium]
MIVVKSMAVTDYHCNYMLRIFKQNPRRTWEKRKELQWFPETGQMSKLNIMTLKKAKRRNFTAEFNSVTRQL